MARKSRHFLVTSASIFNILGVVYAHRKTSNGGDLYFTRYGLRFADLLQIENWYEKEWFETHRERLTGTSSVYKVPTKKINNRSLNLVVKNCRVGEDVPLDTHTLLEFINAEFNSPWEEFSLVMEMRESMYGPKNLTIKTQRPLCIYVPPERLQLWQTGRSRDKINKITRRHPGINLDILRQYKLVYEWIEGLNIIEAFKEIGIEEKDLNGHLDILTKKSIGDLDAKGYIVADMKPSHIIIDDHHVSFLRTLEGSGDIDRLRMQTDFIYGLVASGRYSVVDYELLLRTPGYEEQVKNARRHSYLDDQRDRFAVSKMPQYLTQCDIFGVPYVHGQAESTGGLLWVVGRNPRLFDYFLPERWRRTPCRSLSDRHEIYYTVTKDNIHIVWKTSRIGEKVQPDEQNGRASHINEVGFNSPFEEFAIAQYLSDNGVPTVYVRAIYMTGNKKIEPMTDPRHYRYHRHLTGKDNQPILRNDRNYITIRGYYNGPDSWVAAQKGALFEPLDLLTARKRGVLTQEEAGNLLQITCSRLANVGYDGCLLELNDVIVTLDSSGTLVRDKESLPEARICNLELLYRQ